MDELTDGITVIVNAIITLITTLEIIWTWIVEFIQLIVGVGPLAQYALPFDTLIFFLLFAIVGYKTKFAMSDINAILDSMDEYAERGLTKLEHFHIPKRTKQFYKRKRRNR